MRPFIAASFPESVTRELNERVCAIKSKLPPASWVRPETQHLTFAFLGEQPESLIETLSAEVTTHVGRSGAFDGTLHGCGFFPNRRHARVGWVGVGPEDRFVNLARGAREG